VTKSLDDAEAEWLSISTPSDRPLLGNRDRPLPGAFRELDGVAAWVKWEQDAGWICRLEKTTAAGESTGGAKALLRKLMAISDRHGVSLRGNVVCLPTAECPEPDLERLIALYRGLGFGVSDTPMRVLHYPASSRNFQPSRGDA
jgi:hypothetical protein